MDDRYFMLKAIEKAKLGIKKGQTPFGACIAKNGKIIALEHNHVWEKKDPTAHAEVAAIRKACKKLKTIKLDGCIIYSTTEPCPMCFTACHWAGIKKIVYGTRIEDAKGIGFKELEIHDSVMQCIGESPIEITPEFMRKECVALLDEWRKRKNRKKY
jgi:guanine deaminase